MKERIDFRMQTRGFLRGIDVLITHERNGKLFVAKPILFEAAKENNFEIIPPTLVIPDKADFFEVLRRELQYFGGLQSADASTMSAMKYHLEDMRKLVFKDGNGGGQA